MKDLGVEKQWKGDDAGWDGGRDKLAWLPSFLTLSSHSWLIDEKTICSSTFLLSFQLHSWSKESDWRANYGKMKLKGVLRTILVLEHFILGDFLNKCIQASLTLLLKLLIAKRLENRLGRQLWNLSFRSRRIKLEMSPQPYKLAVTTHHHGWSLWQWFVVGL